MEERKAQISKALDGTHDIILNKFQADLGFGGIDADVVTLRGMRD